MTIIFPNSLLTTSICCPRLAHIAWTFAVLDLVQVCGSRNSGKDTRSFTMRIPGCSVGVAIENGRGCILNGTLILKPPHNYTNHCLSLYLYHHY